MNSSGDINILLDNGDKLDDFLQILVPLGIGGEGACYLFRGRALKIFNGLDYWVQSASDEFNYNLFEDFDCEIDDSLIPDKEYIMRYARIQNKTFVFANGVFSVNGKIRGFLMPLITIPKLSKFNIHSTKYSNLTRACKRCTKDIKLISEKGVKVTDIADVNTYFDGNTIQFADTLGFEDVDSMDAIKSNCSLISKFLIDYFTPNIIKKSLILDKNIMDLYKDRANIECPSIYFETLRNHLSNVCDTPVDTISNAEKILRKTYRNNY